MSYICHSWDRLPLRDYIYKDKEETGAQMQNLKKQQQKKQQLVIVTLCPQPETDLQLKS